MIRTTDGGAPGPQCSFASEEDIRHGTGRKGAPHNGLADVHERGGRRHSGGWLWSSSRTFLRPQEITLFRLTKKKIVAAGVGLATVFGASAAFAYWTSSGSGTGTALTGSATNFEVTTDPLVGAPLTPGGPAQTI